MGLLIFFVCVCCENTYVNSSKGESCSWHQIINLKTLARMKLLLTRLQNRFVYLTILSSEKSIILFLLNVRDKKITSGEIKLVLGMFYTSITFKLNRCAV